jgi:phosphatidate phosphatase LPIN
MKLGEGGEAFFVFQTDGDIPEEMQTSPIVSPAQSPVLPDVLTSVNSVKCPVDVRNRCRVFKNRIILI